MRNKITPIDRIAKAGMAALSLLALCLFAVPAMGEEPRWPTKTVTTEGACAISGMSAEQAQLIAIQRARSLAIEEAAGIRVTSATLVRDGSLAVDFLRSYSRGFIVKEKQEWLPEEKQQDTDRTKPPIHVYRVRITADVKIPDKRVRPLGFVAGLNKRIFRSGERARIEVSSEREARIAVFNIMADDRVAMLFPNPLEAENLLVPGKKLLFPSERSRVDIVMQTLPGHARDAEAFFVVAIERAHERDFSKVFASGEPVLLPAFFEQYVAIAEFAEDMILPYIVERNE